MFLSSKGSLALRMCKQTYFHLEVFTHEPTAAFGSRLVYHSCIRCRVSIVEE